MSSGGGGTGATASYYQQGPQHGDQQSHPQHSPTKYPENGHDTLSDFVHFVCQEAETQETQVGLCFMHLDFQTGVLLLVCKTLI